jgi:hypothetical protein
MSVDFSVVLSVDLSAHSSGSVCATFYASNALRTCLTNCNRLNGCTIRYVTNRFILLLQIRNYAFTQRSKSGVCVPRFFSLRTRFADPPFWPALKSYPSDHAHSTRQDRSTQHQAPAIRLILYRFGFGNVHVFRHAASTLGHWLNNSSQTPCSSVADQLPRHAVFVSCIDLRVGATVTDG